MSRERFVCFISYTTRDSEARTLKRFIDAYLDELRQRGYDIEAISPLFYDYIYRREPFTDSLRDFLAKSLDRSGFMIAFLSPNYIRSKWCLFEWATMESIENDRRLNRSEACSDVFDILPICWKYIGEAPQSMWRRIWLLAVDSKGIYAADPHCRIEEAAQRCAMDTVIYIRHRQRRLKLP
jgi:hypothetical protein